MKTVSMILCMGSSCFSRGNAQNLTRIQTFLREHDLDAEVSLKGCRCGSACADGPNLWVDGRSCRRMTPEALDGVLQGLLDKPADAPAPGTSASAERGGSGEAP